MAIFFVEFFDKNLLLVILHEAVKYFYHIVFTSTVFSKILFFLHAKTFDDSRTKRALEMK